MGTTVALADTDGDGCQELLATEYSLPGEAHVVDYYPPPPTPLRIGGAVSSGPLAMAGEVLITFAPDDLDYTSDFGQATLYSAATETLVVSGASARDAVALASFSRSNLPAATLESATGVVVDTGQYALNCFPCETDLSDSLGGLPTIIAVDADGHLAPWGGGIWLFDLPLNGASTRLAARTLMSGSTEEDMVRFVWGGSDFDGDGWTDLAFGAYGHNDWAGGAGLISSPPPGVFDIWTLPFATVTGTDPFEQVGYAAWGADLDGDGHQEFGIGSPLRREGSRAQVFRGPVTGDLTVRDAGWVIENPDPLSWAGYAGASADFDGDGFMDLAIGQPSHGYVSELRGSILLFRGPVPTGHLSPADADVVVRNEHDAAWNDWFGRPLATGDLDADGFADLAIGAYGDEQDGEGHGSVQLLFGSADLFPTAPGR